MKILLRIALIASLLFAASASANEANKEVNYIPMKPSFVTNYESKGGSLSYVKTDISLRVETHDDTKIVERHLPAIRHHLIMFFTQQSSDTINNSEGRQEMRLKALEIVQALMTEEQGVPIVTDLLFDNFVVQG